MPRQNHAIAVAAASLFPALTALAGSMTINVVQTAPTDNIVDSFVSSENNSKSLAYTTTAGPSDDDGQQFKPAGTSSYSIDKITVRVSSVGSGVAGSEMRLRLYDFGGGNGVTPTSLTPVVDDLGNFPAGSIANNSYLTFDVTDTALTGGSVYGWVLNFTSAAAGRSMIVLRHLTNGPNQGDTVQAMDPTGGAMGDPTFLADRKDRTYYVQSVPATPTWNTDASGAWLDGANWTGGVSPNASGAEAILGGKITATRTVAIGAGGTTVGKLTLDNASAYVVDGPGALTFDKAGGATLTVNSGAHTINAPIALTSALSVNVPSALTLTVATLRGAQALTLNSGTLKLAAGAGTSKVSALSLAGGTVPTSTLDLADNKLIVDYTGVSPLPGVVAQLRSGRNGYDANIITNWNGRGIVSSKARTQSVAAGFDLFGLGSINNADLADASIGRDTYTSFGGVTADSSSVLVRYTYSGDADLNGQVDGDDYALIDNAFNALIPNFGWLSGDFNYDGNVDGDDYALIDSGFLFQASPIPAAAVPEPGTLSLLALGLTALVARRVRR